jgi:hypothetical protein
MIVVMMAVRMIVIARLAMRHGIGTAFRLERRLNQH